MPDLACFAAAAAYSKLLNYALWSLDFATFLKFKDYF
jgi:hypothetical protein